MIGDILLKVVNGQTLTQAEKNELLNLNYIDIAKPQVRDLSQISEDLGHVRLGSVICGTGDPFDQTSGNFTGMGIFNPPITTATGDYNLVGMNAGTLEAGISATDGKLYAGGGEVVIGSDGVTLALGTGSRNAVSWSDGLVGADPIEIIAFEDSVSTRLRTTVLSNIAGNVTWMQFSVQNHPASPDDCDMKLVHEAAGKVYLSVFGSLYIGSSMYDVNTFLTTGWINDANTWTYASASTFTVSGDQRATFAKGTRLKWTQTTVKYGVVASSSYNAGTDTTTVTIVVNTDYTIANAAISANYFSYLDNPLNWPGWFNYTSTLAWTAGTAPTGTPSTNLAMFNIVGTTCQVSIFKAGYTAGATVTALTATLPVSASPAAQNGYGLIRAANAPNICISYINTIAIIVCASAAATAMHFSATYKW